MRAIWWRSWLGAVALVVVGGTAVMPARAGDPPGDKPAAKAKDRDEARRLNAEVERLYKQGKYDEALPLAERALSLREQAVGVDHPDVGESLNNLAGLYHAKGDYARAEPYYQRALRIREQTLGANHPDVGESLNNLAGLYKDKGDYAQAEPLYQRALRILEKALGLDHPNLAYPLLGLAELYRRIGDYATAETYYQRSLSIRERALGPDHPHVATSLNSLAVLYKDKGDYARAEPLYQRALRLWEKSLGSDHPRVAASLDNLAELYRTKGDYRRAEPLYQRALSILEKALGTDHLDVGTSLNNLAVLYKDKGDYTRAEPLHQRALSILEKALGPDHPDVAASLNNLAELSRAQGDYTRAEPLYQRALRIYEKALGPDHPDVALSLNNLALLFEAKGDYTRAEPLHQRALSILEKALGPDHPHVAKSLNNLSVNYTSQGRLMDAILAQQRCGAIQERNAALNLAMGSEAQKRAYMATLTDATHRTVSLHVLAAPSNTQAARLALTTILQRKGRVLDAMADGLAALRRHLTPSDQARFDQLSSVKSQLGVQLFRGPGKLSTEQYKKNLQALENDRQKLEKDLGDRNAAFRAEQRPVTLEHVQQAIPGGAALLEIFRYNPFHPKADHAHRWGRPRYVAYVLRRQGDPSFVDLGEATSIDAAVTEFHSALADSNTTHDPKPAARALDVLVMQPIRALLGNAPWVLLSPDGTLNLIPFEALVDEQGRYLIERFAFTYLTSGRDLIRFEEHVPPKQGAVIVADPDFDGSGFTPTSGPGTGQRGLRSVAMTTKPFKRLSTTAEEAHAIAQDLSDAQKLLGAAATEGAVKAVNAPRILHLATHGFFVPDQPEPALPNELEPTPQEIAALMQRENPLLRAGLALAGANKRISGDKDDGILTALEVSGMNLIGTKLVVLSACETGVGETVSGEGVYGMRRALVMAGAETQVMSLWDVDTARTTDLMVAYYKKLKAGAGRSEALRQAQLEMLGRGKTSHPNLWASFIVSGDWRTLEEAPVTPDLSVHPGPGGCHCVHAGAGGAEGGLGVVLTAFAIAGLAGRRRLRARRG